MHKTGILGGTFNPIHVGHLLLAEWALDALGLEEVWLLPSGESYMKSGQDVLPARERLHMTQLAAAENRRLRCVDTEVQKPGASYTCETLEQLNRENPGTAFYFILGADCLFTMERWREPERIFAACTLVAAMRGERSAEEMEQKKRELERRFGARILLLPFLQVEVSSTQVRERVAGGRSIRYLVPDSVRAYIEEKGFYSGDQKGFAEAEEKSGKGAGCQKV